MSEIYIDDDGFWRLVSGSERGELDPASDFPSTERQHANLDMVHYLLRASIVPQMEDGVSEKGKLMWRKWSESCLQCAVQYAGSDYRFKNLPNPRWVDMLFSEVQSWFIDRYPGAAGVTLRTMIAPGLYARSYPRRREIEISLIAREMLRGVALECWNWVFGTLSPEHEWTDSTSLASGDGQARSAQWIFFRSMAPLYRRVSISALPTVRAVERIAMDCAVNTCGLQVQFMLAHELAHSVLHDGQPASTQREIEADQLAYSVIYEHVPRSSQGSLWTAIRWLFTFLSIERSVGFILASGCPPSNNPLELRLGEIYPYARVGGIADHEIMLEQIGTDRLKRFQAEILALPAGGLRALADSYEVEFTKASPRRGKEAEWFRQ